MTTRRRTYFSKFLVKPAFLNSNMKVLGFDLEVKVEGVDDEEVDTLFI